MAKIPINIYIDSDLLANLHIYASQTQCTVTELIEQFCQQGLTMANDSSADSDVRVDAQKDHLITRITDTEKNVKAILERISILESKVDVDIDVNEYLGKWQKSLEPEIANLVEKRVQEILEVARSLAETGHLDQAISASNVKPLIPLKNKKQLLDDYQKDLDDDEEPDEILTDFLEP